jgi:hypothetical protein
MNYEYPRYWFWVATALLLRSQVTGHSQLCHTKPVRSVILPGQQHIAHYSNPELLAEVILKFLLK